MPWLHAIWLTLYLLTVFGLSLYGFHRFLILFWYWRHGRRPLPTPPSASPFPFVTVQLPLYNERFVVTRLLDAVANLDYPRDRLQIQVLDDSTDDTTELVREKVAELSQAGLNIEAIHRQDRSGYKAGALQNGLTTAKGEIIYILDADFLPEPKTLLEIIPFFTNPKVGMVQARWGHLNRTDSALTRIQSLFLDGHFLLEQTARSRSGRFLHFNGTAGAWRKSCIEDAGGWQHDTLTEDLDLSIRAQLKYWEFKFLPAVVTPAELPADMDAFKTQQHRWTKGAIQNAKKLLRNVWVSPVSFKVKAEATVQLTCNFVYLLMAILCVLSLPLPWLSVSVPGGWVPGVLAFICSTLSVIIFYLFSARTLYPRDWLRDAMHVPLMLALGVGMTINNCNAVLEALRGSHSPFVRTPKFGSGTPKSRKASKKVTSYRSVPPPTLLLELLGSLIFSTLAGYTVWQQNWGAVPVLALFAIGYHLVAWPSFLAWCKPLQSEIAGAEYQGT